MWVATVRVVPVRVLLVVVVVDSLRLLPHALSSSSHPLIRPGSSC